MSRRNATAWLTVSAGLLSVLGALVIFFSWTVTNMLGQRYSRLKQSVETAQSTFRLYTTLNMLREELASIGGMVVDIRNEFDRTARPEQSRHSEARLIRNMYDRERHSARQFHELMEFTAQTLSFSSQVGTETETARRIASIHREVYALYDELHQRDRAASAQASLQDPDLVKLRPAVDEYVRFVREKALPSVRGYSEAIADASNRRHQEGRDQLGRAKQNSERASRAALFLYVIGSLLALGGQYIDKVVLKKKPAPPP